MSSTDKYIVEYLPLGVADRLVRLGGLKYLDALNHFFLNVSFCPKPIFACCPHGPGNRFRSCKLGPDNRAKHLRPLALVCNTSQANLDTLNKVQKRAGKIVSGAIRGISSDTLYNELSWETLDARREKRMMILYSDIVHNRAPSYLHSHIPQTVQERTQGRYNLRNRNNLSQPASRTETYKNSYFPTMAGTWNTTDHTIQSIQSRTTLKSTLNQNNQKPNPFFNLGRRKLNITLARLRMECSQLNSHLFAMHIIPNPDCQCGLLETTTHYFLECPTYALHRTQLANQLSQLELDLTVETIMHGTSDPVTDLRLIEYIDEFITGTNRFTLLDLNNGTQMP